MPVSRLAVRLAIRIDPTSAVPSEAPMLVAVFCSPPTSGLSSSGTADTVTAPSWEARAPIPSPTSSNGSVTISAEASSSMAASSTTVPANMARSPRRTTRRGLASGRKRGIPIAAISRVIDSGRSRTPVSIADSPSDTDRNSGTTKNSPDCTKNWKKNIRRPPTICVWRKMDGRTSGSSPRSSSRDSQVKNSQSTKAPPRISHKVAEIPHSSGASGLGDTHPHTLERRTPKTARPSPPADSTTPRRSIRGRSPTGSSSIRRASTRIASTIRTSPANT